MHGRKILGPSATALVVAAAFGAPSHVAAADTSVQFYGHLDLSVDDATKGIKEGGAGQNPAPVGKVGWQADVSSNLSYFGFRGDHDLPPKADRRTQSKRESVLKASSHATRPDVAAAEAH